MKKICLVILACCFLTGFALADSPHASVTRVRRKAHKATRHHAHKAGRHKAPRHNTV